MTALLADFVITLLPTLVLSRLLLWLTKIWSASMVRLLLVVHFASLALCLLAVRWVAAGSVPDGWTGVSAHCSRATGVAAGRCASPGSAAATAPFMDLPREGEHPYSLS